MRTILFLVVRKIELGKLTCIVVANLYVSCLDSFLSNFARFNNIIAMHLCGFNSLYLIDFIDILRFSFRETDKNDFLYDILN